MNDLDCTPEYKLNGAVSSLHDEAYQWWNTLVSVVPRERVSWNFFQAEFKKKYISKRFINQKRKEFLELKQCHMSVTEYEREFVRLSKYAWECISTEEIMCKRFKDGLNRDIRLLVGILELKEFVVLIDRACKAEKLGKEKRKVDFEAKYSRKRSMNKPYQFLSKKSRDLFSRSNTSIGYPNKDRGKQYSSPKAQATSVSSVVSVRNNKPECQQCGRRQFGDYWMINNNKAYLRCGSQEHFIRDCPQLSKKDNLQTSRLSNPATRGRPPRNTGNVTSSRGITKDSAVRSDTSAPARAYTICACEVASSPNAKIAEEVKCMECQNKDRERGKNKRDSKPSTSVQRPKRKARLDGPIRVGVPVAPTGI
ncbi:uncharacterized protein [Gossypium hirsutum]|uniref:Retrotransposon gag domain-containing protein n=1 Tax=Gossypium hirsutum TaxID=3635 RepID=A0ABM2YQ82_GOSHI|nr:uncharacterized protein LOC107945389 [Gossypium hirsutum]